MLKRSIALIAAALITTGAAHAQAKKGPNGGVVVTSEGHPIEFVPKGQEIVFYVRDDDGSPLATNNMRGRATVQDGGKTVTVPLQPAAPNMLVGKLQAPLGSKARVAFSASVSAGSHSHSLT